MASVVIEEPKQTDVAPTRTAVEAMRALSFRALRRMYLPDEKLFVHCIRQGGDGDVPEGVSRRYTAIVLIGLVNERKDDTRTVFGSVDDVQTVCDRLLEDVTRVENMGDVALTLWAAVALKHPNASKALNRLRSLDPVDGDHPTVEVAWAVTALNVGPNFLTDERLSTHVARRLKGSFNRSTGVFPHWPYGVPRPFARSHVSCFADLVYPVQALSIHYQSSRDESSLEAARRAGRFMRDTQGSQGQWWWHFDHRSGRVVEGYPVYAVHQDSMAPMALFALQDASGDCFDDAIDLGLQWMLSVPELGGVSLVDDGADLIWRKVARHEPGKLSRGIQALTSRVHPSLRAPLVVSVFRPGKIDYECRPYHLGWILHAWPADRVNRWPGGDDQHSDVSAPSPFTS